MFDSIKKIAQNAAIDVSAAVSEKEDLEKFAADAAYNGPVRRPKVFLPEAYDYDACVKAAAEQQQAELDEDDEPLWNEQLTETAGFVPLEVRMKQMEQAGILQQAMLQDITADDLREAWLTSDFDIAADDELEEIIAKDRARREFIETIKAQRQKEFDEQQSKSLGSMSKEQYEAVINSLVEKYNITPKTDSEEADTQADSGSK